MAAEIYGPQRLWTGFRTPALMRLVASEEAYLSNTHGGPRLYINMEDYISAAAMSGNNPRFQQVMGLFRDKCNARLHWGKAGWKQTYAACFDGAKEYSEWCDFGCAVVDLDPTGKFNGLSDVWNWSATRSGSYVDYDSCCTPEGFDHSSCACSNRPSYTCTSPALA
jgi:hypothetical protein